MFAPNDMAFKNIPQPELAALINDTNKLRKVLSRHIIQDKMLMNDNFTLSVENFTTMNNDTITIEKDKGGNKTWIVFNNTWSIHDKGNSFMAGKGIVHIIDVVLYGMLNYV